MRGRFGVLLTVVRNPHLARLEVGFVCFSLLEHGGWVAVLFYAYERGGVAEAGVAALVQLIPAAVIAPVAALAGDRHPRARVLTASHLTQAIGSGLLAVTMLADMGPVPVYAAATLLAVTITFSRPAMGALLPTVTESPIELTGANVVAGLIENTGRFAGPVLAGMIVALSEPGTVFAGAAVMMIAATALTASVRSSSRPAVPDDDPVPESMWRELAAGFSLLRTRPGPRLVVGLMTATNVIIGALDVLFVAVAVELLGREEATGGLLSGAAGLGGVIGAATTVALVDRRRLTPPIAAGALLTGVPLVVLAGVDGIAFALLLFGLAGVGKTIVAVGSRTLLQGITPDDVLARVFGIHEGLTMAAYALGSIAVAGLGEWLGISGTLAVVGAALPVVMVLAAKGLLDLDARRPEPDHELLALVRSVPVFAPLPPYTIEQLVVNLERVQPAPGELLMQEGDQGRDMYLIGDGEAEVWRDGQLVHRCERGDHVGEVALLLDVPRTATVLAGEGLVAHRLDRDVFLEAVTGHPRSLARAGAVANRRHRPVR